VRKWVAGCCAAVLVAAVALWGIAVLRAHTQAPGPSRGLESAGSPEASKPVVPLATVVEDPQAGPQSIAGGGVDPEPRHGESPSRVASSQRHGEGKARLEEIWRLSVSGEPSQTVSPQAIAALGAIVQFDPHEACRMQAVLALQHTRAVDGAEHLCRALQDGSAKVRESAAYALASEGWSKAGMVAKLIPVFRQEKDDRVASALVDTISRGGDPETLEFLRGVLFSDPRSAVRRTAAYGLQRCSGADDVYRAALTREKDASVLAAVDESLKKVTGQLTQPPDETPLPVPRKPGS